MYRKYSAFVEAVNSRWKRYNAQSEVLEMLEKEERIFVVRPSRIIKVGRLEKDPEVLQEMYELGLKDAEEALERMKAYLEP